MSQRVIIPRLGQTMTEGVVAKWYKKDGDKISAGEDVYELEYDKSTATIQAKKSGIIRLLVSEGSVVPLGDTVAIVLESGETLEEILAQKTYSVANAAKAIDKPIPVAVSSDKNDADAIIIGGGPGGYVCAIRLGLHGKKVILVEKAELGGTCLNRGCIPTKALLQSAERYLECMNSAEFGIYAQNVSFDLTAVDARKRKVVNTLVNGVEGLLKARKVEVVHGEACLKDNNTVAVNLNGGGEKVYSAANIIIAAGSEPSMPPIPGIDGKNIITSNEALNLETIPSSMIIIGGGVIGMELGTVYSAFGCKVTIIEAMPEILPNMDAEISKIYRRSIRRIMDVKSGAKVTGITDNGDSKSVTYQIGDRESTANADVVLIAIGRKPCTAALGLDNVGIKSDRGRVSVNDEFMTNITGVYCIGDANGRIMLAHAASAQGIEVADRIAGIAIYAGNKHSIVPSCIYTDPEIASVGKTEEQLKTEGTEYKVCKFSLRANGRALVLGKQEGFVKILASTKHNEILGVHIIGPAATELIAECALAMRLEACAEDIAETIHAHPTVSEAIMEAAEAGLYGPIHSL